MDHLLVSCSKYFKKQFIQKFLTDSGKFKELFHGKCWKASLAANYIGDINQQLNGHHEASFRLKLFRPRTPWHFQTVTHQGWKHKKWFMDSHKRNCDVCRVHLILDTRFLMHDVRRGVKDFSWLDFVLEFRITMDVTFLCCWPILLNFEWNIHANKICWVQWISLERFVRAPWNFNYSSSQPSSSATLTFLSIKKISRCCNQGVRIDAWMLFNWIWNFRTGKNSPKQ